MTTVTTSVAMTTLVTHYVMATRENYLNNDVTSYQPMNSSLSLGLTNKTLTNNSDELDYYSDDQIPDYPKVLL